jgi:hypothetical protein
MANASMQQQEDTQEQLNYQAMVREYGNDAHRFSQTEEGQHFWGDEGAYQFLKNSRLVELSFALYDKDPTDPNVRFTQQEIDRIVAEFNAEERQLVGDALQNSRSPTRTIMRYARARGWRPPQPRQAAPPTRQPATSRSGGRSPLAQPQAATARNAIAQIQAEQAGAAASRSLSDGGGTPPGEPLSIDQLLRMDDEEFGIYVDNLPKARLDAIMGRDFPGRG